MADFNDDRMKKSSVAASRGSRDGADASRENKDGTAYTPEERRRMMRSEWVNEVLPTPPVIPGWHFCWLSTTNGADPIYKRVRQGYIPVKSTELPGFDTFKAQGGEFDGCVACNEMVLFKIPEDVYQDIMTIFHHEMPAEMEQAIYEKLVSGQEVDSSGRPVMTVEGDFERLRQPGRAPSFS
jgi:hypothetical protein